VTARPRPTTLVADTVGIYLDEVSAHVLLTAEDEVSLARAIERGRRAQSMLDTKAALSSDEQARLRQVVSDGDEAKMAFIRSNLRLVISIAKRYTGRGLDFLDLIQEGNLGLMRAVEKFDWRKGFKFSTYATWWIRQAITRGLGNQARTIRLPVHMVDVVRTVEDTHQMLANELHRPPTIEEIAEASGLEVEQVRAALSAPDHTVSLDKPVGEDGDARLQDFVEDSSAPDPFARAADTLTRDELRRALSILDSSERQIIWLRFGLDGAGPRTLSDVGKLFGLTRERVRQIESRGLAKLRHPSASVELEALL